MPYIKTKTKILLLSIGFSYFTSAQQIQVTGKVTDSLQNPLGYANILAMPESVIETFTNPPF